MNFYETLFIVHPALESGRLKDIIQGVESTLKNLGSNLLSIELWGKKKLAYLIDKQKYGTYVLFQFSGEGKGNRDLGIELEHNPNILAYMTTSIDESDIIEQVEDLDTQIAGKSREAEKDEKHTADTEVTSEQETTPVAEISEIDLTVKNAESGIEIVEGASVGSDEGAESAETTKEDDATEPLIEITEVPEETTETHTDGTDGQSEDGGPIDEQSQEEDIVQDPELDTAESSEDEADSEPQGEEQEEESKETAEETAAVKEGE